MTRHAAWGIIVILLGMMACKPKIPSQYLRPNKMVDVLYDYHLADGVVLYEGNSGNSSERQMAYRLEVLHKHGVTQEQLDSSLAYYFRHTEELQKIYEEVAKRLSDEAIALGASANDIRLYGEEGLRGDTSNVWVGPPTAILLPNEPNNIIKFHLNADTTYHIGDKVMLVFDSQFIVQEGSRDAVAILAMRFENDSVAKTQINISSNNHYSLQMTDNNHLGIKEIRGFIYMPTPLSDKKTTTLKILSLSNIKAVKMHEKVKEKQEEIGGDSRQQAIPTTLPESDSARSTSPKAIPGRPKDVGMINPVPGKPTSNPQSESSTTTGGNGTTERGTFVKGKPKHKWNNQ
ncbi:MAG: DUF4296 domain-containing protein [Prevotella sp.]|nr:DUF4296 domain-containing protein [Prevotella sp.]